MHYSRDPPAICCYFTTFLSITRRLLSSRDELAREVQAGASPLSRFLSLSGHIGQFSKIEFQTHLKLKLKLKLWTSSIHHGTHMT